MDNFSINGQAIKVQGVKELDPTLSIQEAAQKTRKNGLDEVYFTLEGKNYIAYGDNMDLRQLEKSKFPAISLNGKTGTFVTFEDEKNTVMNGIKTGALDGLKNARNILNNATNSTMKSIGPASIVATGGALLLTGIVIAKGGVVAASASPLSKLLGDVLVNSSTKALKGVAIAGVIGLGISVGVGSVVGVAESLSTEKDYSTIAAVTKEGNYKVIPSPPKPVDQPPNPPKDDSHDAPSPPKNDKKMNISGGVVVKLDR